MYVRTYIQMYTQVCMFEVLCVHVCHCVCMYVRVNHMYVCLLLCMFVCIMLLLWVNVCTYVHIMCMFGVCISHVFVATYASLSASCVLVVVVAHASRAWIKPPRVPSLRTRHSAVPPHTNLPGVDGTH